MFTGFWTDLFLILIAGDSFSTNLALNNGASEANKLYSFLSAELGAVLWAGKMVLGLGVILVIRKSKPEWLWVFRVLCIALSLVIINNMVWAFTPRL
jgi:hypothetical protein